MDYITTFLLTYEFELEAANVFISAAATLFVIRQIRLAGSNDQDVALKASKRAMRAGWIAVGSIVFWIARVVASYPQYFDAW